MVGLTGQVVDPLGVPIAGARATLVINGVLAGEREKTNPRNVAVSQSNALVAVLFMTPITIQRAISLGISPLTLLLPETLASNIEGISRLVGTPTNILYWAMVLRLPWWIWTGRPRFCLG